MGCTSEGCCRGGARGVTPRGGRSCAPGSVQGTDPPRRPGERGWTGAPARPRQPKHSHTQSPLRPAAGSGSPRRCWRRESEKRANTSGGNGEPRGAGCGAPVRTRGCRPLLSPPDCPPRTPPCRAGTAGAQRHGSIRARILQPLRLLLHPSPRSGASGLPWTGLLLLGLLHTCGCQQLAEPATGLGCKWQPRGGRSHPFRMSRSRQPGTRTRRHPRRCRPKGSLSLGPFGPAD